MDQIFTTIGDAIGSIFDNPVAPYLAASFVIVFTPILFPLAVFTYKVIRPQEKIGEVYERNLAEEAMLGEIEAIPHCPNCDRRVEAAWIICPTCRTRLNRVCPNCTRLVGLDWTLCAWCGREFERHDQIAASAAAPIVSLPIRDALPAGELEAVNEPMRPATRASRRTTDQVTER